MKAEYDITDLASSFYASHRRLDASESVFYSPDPNFPAHKAEAGSPALPTVGAPWFDRIGVAEVAFRNILFGTPKETRVPVLEKGVVVGFLRVVVTPISTHPPDGNDEGGLVDGGVVVVEVAVLEMSGVGETEFTQVHCQFRLSEFGRGRPVVGLIEDGREVLGTRFEAVVGGEQEEIDEDEGVEEVRNEEVMGVRDRLFCTDPVSDFGDGPVRWEFSQTLVVPVTERVRGVVEGGLVRFDVFGRRVRSVISMIDQIYRLGTDDHKRLGLVGVSSSLSSPKETVAREVESPSLPCIPLPKSVPSPLEWNPRQIFLRRFTEGQMGLPKGRISCLHNYKFWSSRIIRENLNMFQFKLVQESRRFHIMERVTEVFAVTVSVFVVEKPHIFDFAERTRDSARWELR
ncbi:hypothetical protein BC829DRAFT_210036 [Chytridium lagenaria]|nr:hypothetical protein BC829DRAFT_210036 [Chytridium lagenaria]